MRKTIRRNCFETNSSSMHSIVVTKEDREYTEDELANELDIYSRSNLDFDRSPFQILFDFQDKVEYVIASYCTYKPEKYCRAFVKKLESIIREELPDFKSIDLPHESKPVYLDINEQELDPEEVHWDRCEKNKETGKKEQIYYYLDKNGNKYDAARAGYWKDYDYFGYVDHQSLGLLEGFLKTEDITLKEFLFNKKYVVIIDGDEYYYFENLKESGLYNADNVVREFPDVSDTYGQLSYDSLKCFQDLEDLK